MPRPQPEEHPRSWVPLFVEKACDESGSDQLMSAWAWMASLDPSAAEFAEDIHEAHPILWWDRWMSRVEAAIDEGSSKAAAIGLNFIIEDPRTPSGKIHKQNVLRRLRRNLALVPPEAIKPLELVLGKFDRYDYKPREYNDLKRLILALRASLNTDPRS